MVSKTVISNATSKSLSKALFTGENQYSVTSPLTGTSVTIAVASINPKTSTTATISAAVNAAHVSLNSALISDLLSTATVTSQNTTTKVTSGDELQSTLQTVKTQNHNTLVKNNVNKSTVNPRSTI